MLSLVLVVGIALFAGTVALAIDKHITVTEVEAELKSLESKAAAAVSVAVADVRAAIAAIRAKL